MFRIALLALCFVHKSWADNAGCDARPAFRDFHPLSSRGLAAARRAGFAVTRAGLAFIPPGALGISRKTAAAVPVTVGKGSGGTIALPSVLFRTVRRRNAVDGGLSGGEVPASVMRFLAEWDRGTTWAEDDVVTYDGYSYIRISGARNCGVLRSV